MYTWGYPMYNWALNAEVLISTKQRATSSHEEMLKLSATDAAEKEMTAKLSSSLPSGKLT